MRQDVAVGSAGRWLSVLCTPFSQAPPDSNRWYFCLGFLLAWLWLGSYPSPSEGQKIILVETPAGTTHEMAVVPEGAFEMGFSPTQEESLREEGWWESHIGGLEEAKPRHTVSLSAYAIDLFEVTNSQYEAYREAMGASRPMAYGRGPGAYSEDNLFNGSEHPVMGVTWYEARDYCAWAGLRLPTEAEWERAAVAGDDRLFAWGSDLRRDHVNYGIDQWCGGPDELCYTEDDSDGFYFTAPVGSFPSGRSAFGLFDLTGNVLEWVSDWYLETYYRESPQQDPTGPGEDRGEGKVLRGGSYASLPYQLLSSYRRHNDPHLNYAEFGFRCAGSLSNLDTAVLDRGWADVKEAQRSLTRTR